ncbi:SDR family NAD(P)-dependent oxidoreductase [Curtobacterium sp. 22159]|uniref:SDR family NAD(P)-dependent oxidoreductase n=1 Tax=Curtobacterium sp. 22159 TaxID=3453882 RepID=UPI003F82D4A3
MKTWLVTGASKGFGRVWALAALERGDRVVATARKVDSLASLRESFPENALTLPLDVTDREAVGRAIVQAKERFDRIDVLINNAGFGLFGSVEEVSEEQARAQLETNLFGALWVTQAVLPTMRAQHAGHIIQVSSIGGVNAFPGLGLYHASKWGLEGLSQSLSQEVRDFGIKVTLVEPGGYSTDWGTASAAHAEPLEAYRRLRDSMAQIREHSVASIGDPTATASVMLELVDMKEPPLRMLFGSGINEMIHDEYQKRLAEWDAHKALSEQAQGETPGSNSL